MRRESTGRHRRRGNSGRKPSKGPDREPSVLKALSTALLFSPSLYGCALSLDVSRYRAHAPRGVAFAAAHFTSEARENVVWIVGKRTSGKPHAIEPHLIMDVFAIDP